jgi:DNA adenine methylase
MPSKTEKMTHVCPTCQKAFKQKGHLATHAKRKRPCKPAKPIDQIVEEKVKEVLQTILPAENLGNPVVHTAPVSAPAPVIHLDPLVKWSGGKADEIKHILKHLPPFETYVEPFVGGGSLFFYLNPEKAVINDIHPELIKLYRAIGNGHRGLLKEFMKAHPNAEEEYYRVRQLKPKDDVEAAAQFYYLRKTCFRGMLRYNSKGEFNIPYGRYKSINYSSLDDARYETLLSRTKIMNGGFKEVFEACDTPQHFIFLDPPYDSVFTDYGYCSFGKKEHEELAKLFKASKAKCMMVIGQTDFIEGLYAGYIKEKYPKQYKFKIHSGRVGDEINVHHLVIKNYD